MKHNGRVVCNMKHACELAGCSRRTIYNWLALRRISVLRTPGNRPLFYVDELVRLQRIAKPEAEGA